MKETRALVCHGCGGITGGSITEDAALAHYWRTYCSASCAEKHVIGVDAAEFDAMAEENAELRRALSIGDVVLVDES